jgi:hypothetical protein
MGKHARYCKHCGQPRRATAPGLTLDAVEARLAAVEVRLQTMDFQDPRMGAESWQDTIRRLARDVVREGLR